MTPSPRLAPVASTACFAVCLGLAAGSLADSGSQFSAGEDLTTLDTLIPDTARGNELIGRQTGFFVPNLGQWEHGARYVHRSGPMTLFLQDRGWVIDLVDRAAEPTARLDAAQRSTPGDDEVEIDRRSHGVALRMTFEGDDHEPEIVGEKRLHGHHNYFLGNDENRWRTGVPLYGSIRYERLYPGIDLRLREASGVPEYDLLLRPGADLSLVMVHVEGGQRLSIASDGSLLIETALGPVTQSAPKTWQVGRDGAKRDVACNFVLLGPDRFGFEATAWDGDTSLTIDPGLIWSTYLGGAGVNFATALSVDDSGVLTVAGWTDSPTFPTTPGAYDTTHNGGFQDAFVSRLDPRKTGISQLVYSTFLGGGSYDLAVALSVDVGGVVTVAGRTISPNYPTTGGAYDRTHNGSGNFDVFVSRLDPNKTGSAQLVYSTFLGGGSYDSAHALAVHNSGVLIVTGRTAASNYPTSSGAYDTTHNGGQDIFVSALDPNRAGNAQLVYSTFLGGSSGDRGNAIFVGSSGIVTVTGQTLSSNFPVTRGAYDTTFNGNDDAFVSRLDPTKTGGAQLVYSTFLGGSGIDHAEMLSVDAVGVATVAGYAGSKFPTTQGAYDTTHNGGLSDIFVSRLLLAPIGRWGLLYSTFLGGSNLDGAHALSVDTSGVVTITGRTRSNDFPTTSGAFDTTYNGGFSDVFVSRLDRTKIGTAQLVYSTFLGGSATDQADALAVDASGVVCVAGLTQSADFPTTRGAYDTTYNGGFNDAFLSRLDMGMPLYGDVHAISIKAGGMQRLALNAGPVHRNLFYRMFGSVTGTFPGVNLLGVNLPLNYDAYGDTVMAGVNTAVFTMFRGTLDANGLATASFNVPAKLPIPPGITIHYAYAVYDANGRIYMTSNPVPVTLNK